MLALVMHRRTTQISYYIPLANLSYTIWDTTVVKEVAAPVANREANSTIHTKTRPHQWGC